MTDEAVWIPRGVDTSKSSAARLYDYLLGGGHNFAVDRELGERFAVALPGARDIARLNRALLRRAVLTLAESGIRQFLDVGSGIPTVGNVHEIAQQADPGAEGRLRRQRAGRRRAQRPAPGGQRPGRRDPSRSA
ncbi:MAG: SAM-dependent methyltransferase [Pseudonocardiaceae bacterium]